MYLHSGDAARRREVSRSDSPSSMARLLACPVLLRGARTAPATGYPRSLTAACPQGPQRSACGSATMARMPNHAGGQNRHQATDYRVMALGGVVVGRAGGTEIPQWVLRYQLPLCFTQPMVTRVANPASQEPVHLNNTDIGFLRRAIELADLSRVHHNHPFGAVIVLDGQTISSAEDESLRSGHCRSHAESIAIHRAESELGPNARVLLERATIYSSTEPCYMCGGAILLSGIQRVVFGCSGKTFRSFRPQKKYLPLRELTDLIGGSLTIIGPALEDEAVKSHLDYWKAF